MCGRSAQPGNLRAVISAGSSTAQSAMDSPGADGVTKWSYAENARSLFLLWSIGAFIKYIEASRKEKRKSRKDLKNGTPCHLSQLGWIYGTEGRWKKSCFHGKITIRDSVPLPSIRHSFSMIPIYETCL